MITLSVIVNTESGTLRGVDLEAFEQQIEDTLPASRFRVVSMHRTDRPITDVLDTIAREDSNGILVAGGDGSVSASAALAWRTGRTLAVLPGGTMNLYARTLGMPLELDAALAALAHADERQVDIATANGQAFVHQYTVGLHANAVRLRKRMEYGSRLGKLVATARAFASVILRPGNFIVKMQGDSLAPERYRLSALSVSCNRFGAGHVPYADTPDGGVLGVYRSRPVGYLAALRLVTDITLGTTGSNDDVDSMEAIELKLVFPARLRRQRAMLDGELIDLEPEVDIRLHAGELRVLQPRPATDD